MKRKLLLLAFVLGLGGTACATAQVPDDNYTPKATMAAAQDNGAENLPEAKQHTEVAQDRFDKAKKLKKEGEAEKAKIEMFKAQADADYALALLRRDDQQKEATAIHDRLERLRREIKNSKED